MDNGINQIRITREKEKEGIDYPEILAGFYAIVNQQKNILEIALEIKNYLNSCGIKINFPDGMILNNEIIEEIRGYLTGEIASGIEGMFKNATMIDIFSVYSRRYYNILDNTEAYSASFVLGEAIGYINKVKKRHRVDLGVLLVEIIMRKTSQEIKAGKVNKEKYPLVVSFLVYLTKLFDLIEPEIAEYLQNYLEQVYRQYIEGERDIKVFEVIYLNIKTTEPIRQNIELDSIDGDLEKKVLPELFNVFYHNLVKLPVEQGWKIMVCSVEKNS